MDGTATDAANNNAAATAAAATWAEGLGGGIGDDPGRPGRQTCWAVWHEDLAAFEVLQPRGDSLRSLVSAAVTALAADQVCTRTQKF